MSASRCVKWIKSLNGEIGDASINRFLQIFPNLRRLLVGIPRTRDFIFEDHIDDDLFPLTRDSFALVSTDARLQPMSNSNNISIAQAVAHSSASAKSTALGDSDI